MKKATALLFTLFLLFFTGCEDKKPKKTTIIDKNTTIESAISEKEIIEILGKKNKKSYTSNKNIIKSNSIENNTTNTVISVISTPLPLKGDAYILHDTDQNERTIAIHNKSISISNVAQSIVLINFFTTWSPSCLEEMSYLSDLQKKYKKKLFIIGILVNDEKSNLDLKVLTTQYEAEYFISNSKENNALTTTLLKGLKIPKNFSIPLSILYKNGHYYRHYEGATPIEMIEYDVTQAIK